MISVTRDFPGEGTTIDVPSLFRGSRREPNPIPPEIRAFIVDTFNLS
jgi:hypothetical protein